jgi:hypothetical protein
VAKISDFFEKLATDDDFDESFDDSPRRTMRQFGLDPEQQKLILGGSTRQIREALFEELGHDANIIMVKMR